MKKALIDFGKRLLSRKFILAFVPAVIIFGNKYWAWGLDEKEILMAVAGFLGFMGVEGWADAKRAEIGE